MCVYLMRIHRSPADPGRPFSRYSFGLTRFATLAGDDPGLLTRCDVRQSNYVGDLLVGGDSISQGNKDKLQNRQDLATPLLR